MRCLSLVVILALLCPSVHSEDAIELARTGLEKAKKLYEENVERAKFDLQSAGEKELKKIRSGGKQNVADQVARIEKIEAQLREFSEFDTLPTDTALRDDVDRYRETLSKARQRCEKAFDILAQRYVTAKDDSNAKMVLDEKASYFKKGFVPGMFAITTNPPFGHATLELSPDGNFKVIQDERSITTGTWEQIGKEDLLLKFVSHNYGVSKLKIVDADHLVGENIHPNGATWKWRVIRQSAATLNPGDFFCTTVPDEGRWTFSLKKDGTCTNTSPDGSFVCHGNWQQFGDEVRFEFTSQGNYGGVYNEGKLKIKDKDHLVGTNRHTTENRTWEWTVVRKNVDAPAKK